MLLWLANLGNAGGTATVTVSVGIGVQRAYSHRRLRPFNTSMFRRLSWSL